jgi:hypothetical protein
MDIRLLATYAVMLISNTLTHLIEQAHRLERWPVGRLAGFDGTFNAVHKHSTYAKNPMTRTITDMPRADIDLKQERNPAKLMSTSCYA